MTSGKDLQQNEQEFFSMIGRCIAGYNSMEFAFWQTFSAALGGTESRAAAIWSVVRGLDKRLDLITAALIDHNPTIRSDWQSLKSKIKACSDDRDEIAHAEAGYVLLGHGKGVEQRLRKMRGSKVVWLTISELHTRFQNTDKIITEISDFNKKLGAS